MLFFIDHGDMSVLVVLSHGEKDKIYSSDGRPITTEWWRHFINKLSPLSCFIFFQYSKYS